MTRDLMPRGRARRRSKPWRMIAVLVFAVSGHAFANPSFFEARVAPILDRHCTSCHGAEKQKAGLRVDSYEHLMKGAESGEVIKPGDVKGSELARRITLPRDDDEVMPADGKPLLSADEIKILELWIAGGASRDKSVTEFPGAPEIARKKAPPPLAPDWRPRAREIATLEKELGVRLAPRSQVPTDGLVLRTASAPARCDDAALARLRPVAEFIVDAELARTPVSDAGVAALAACTNLRTLDLTRTAITSRGLESLTALSKLETINLTDTAVDAAGVAKLKALPALKRVWVFGTKAAADAPASVVAH